MYREALACDLGPEWAGRLRLQLMFLSLRQGRTRDGVRRAGKGVARSGLGELKHERIASLMSAALVFSRASTDGRGAYAEAAERIAPSVRSADLRGSRAAYDGRPHMILSLMLMRLDRFDEAQATVQRGRLVAESLGDANAVPVFRYQQALLDFWRGRLDDSLAELNSQAPVVQHMPAGWKLPVESLAALIAIHQNDLIGAQRHLQSAEREAAHGGSPHGFDMMRLARARLLEAMGDTEAAVEALDDAVTASAAAGTVTFMPILAPELARLAVAAGCPHRAARAINSLDRVARLNPGTRSLNAYALQAQGLLDGDQDALRASVELLRTTGRALEAARAAEDLAALDANKASDLLHAARETYRSCRAVRDLARVEAALRAMGARRRVPVVRRRPQHGWSALTDTELTVVRLVAERLTNPEIAQRMFISRRTVQTHVSHALAKLGVATRRELAAEAGKHAGWRLRIDDTGNQPQQRQPAVKAVWPSAIDPRHA